jgi:hypothetical protein
VELPRLLRCRSFAIATGAWRHTTLWFLILMALLAFSVLIYGSGVAWLVLATWRAAQVFGMSFHKCVTMPLEHPERLHGWAKAADRDGTGPAHDGKGSETVKLNSVKPPSVWVLGLIGPATSARYPSPVS